MLNSWVKHLYSFSSSGTFYQAGATQKVHMEHRPQYCSTGDQPRKGGSLLRCPAALVQASRCCMRTGLEAGLVSWQQEQPWVNQRKADLSCLPPARLRLWKRWSHPLSDTHMHTQPCNPNSLSQSGTNRCLPPEGRINRKPSKLSYFIRGTNVIFWNPQSFSETGAFKRNCVIFVLSFQRALQVWDESRCS